jgi:hypothetical protein
MLPKNTKPSRKILYERGFGKTVTLVTRETSADVRRLTPEEVDRAKRLCATGAAKTMAEAQDMVLGERAPVTPEDDDWEYTKSYTIVGR